MKIHLVWLKSLAVLFIFIFFYNYCMHNQRFQQKTKNFFARTLFHTFSALFLTQFPIRQKVHHMSTSGPYNTRVVKCLLADIIVSNVHQINISIVLILMIKLLLNVMLKFRHEKSITKNFCGQQFCGLNFCKILMIN